MNVVNAPPPMFPEICAAFPQATNPGVIFTWGWTIYAPGGGHISEPLLEHERVHATRQEHQGGPEGWWRRYIDDPEFRLAEELPAHKAEYRRWCFGVLDRNARARHLTHVAHKLSAPLYGGIITPRAAAELLRAR